MKNPKNKNNTPTPKNTRNNMNSKNMGGGKTIGTGSAKAVAAVAELDALPEIKPIPRNWHFLIIAAIVLLAFLIYSNSIHNGFVQFDDPENIYENIHIQQINWENLKYFFTTSIQFTYSPLVFLSFAVEYQIGKLDPSVYHFTSLLLHLFNIILVYWLFLLLTKRWTVSAFVAVLFAIHPVNVDGVSWLATRSNVLFTFFYLGALILYIFYLKKDFKIGYLLWSALLFLLAVLSKAPALVLALVLFLVDYFYGRKWDIGKKNQRQWNWKLVTEKIPYFLVAALTAYLTFHFRVDIDNPFGYNLLDRFVVICTAIIAYFVKLIYPFNLAFAYAYPLKEGGFLPWFYYLSPFVLALIPWVLLKLRIPKKVVVFGLAFFVINLILSQTVVLIDNFKANRYAYLPYIGLYFILAGFSEPILTAQTGWRSKLKMVWVALLVVVVASFSYATYQRNFLWKDTIAIFSDSIQKEPNIPFTYITRGLARHKSGDQQGALQDFRKAAELDPNSYLAFYYQAKAQVAIGDSQGALHNFTRALEIKPDYGDVYYERGLLKHQLGNYDGAMTDYDAAVNYNPGAYYNYNSRGITRSTLKDFPGAIADFSKTIELYPGFGESYYYRGMAKLQLNDKSGACADWNQALQLGYPQAQVLINQHCR